MKTKPGILICLALTGTLLFTLSCGSDSGSNPAPQSQTEPKIPLPDMGPENPYPVKVKRGIPIDRPDDPEWKRLYVNVFRPDVEGGFPALLMATAYRREYLGMSRSNTTALAEKGYAVILMDVMGTGSSEGGWESFSNKEIDGIVWVIDNWIPRQPWSNGKVGMFGSSYQGIAAYLTAGRAPEHLKVLYPSMTAADVYRDIFFQGGIFDQEFIGIWAIGTIALSLVPGTQLFQDLESAIRALNDHVKQAPEIVSWMDQTTDRPFFEERSPMTYWEDIARFPVLAEGGWFDIFTRGSLLNHTFTAQESRQNKQPDGYVVPKRIIVGPWYHGTSTPSLNTPLRILRDRWFDWHLKADENPDYRRYDILDPEWPVTLYVMGRDQWRRERKWPVERARNKLLYLSGERQGFDTNISLNNGTLLWEEEWEEQRPTAGEAVATRIAYDPKQEREKFAGQKSRSSVRWMMGAIPFVPWAEDERENERHVLTFSTAPLEQEVEVTGPLCLRLWARTSFGPPCADPPPIWFQWGNLLGVDPSPLIPWAREPNVHWTINLNDVLPSGQVRNITSGWLAASHRPDPQRPDWTRAGYDPFNYPESKDPSTPRDGELYEYVIEIWPTSNQFKAGHQIRIDIAVTDFPHFLPSLVPSESQILHDAAHPSRLILPVVAPETTDPAQWIEQPEDYFSGNTPWLEP